MASSSAIPNIAEDQSLEVFEDSSLGKNDDNIQVIIRLRPLSSSEISSQGSSKCIRKDSSHTVTWTGHPESKFTFDIVADENFSQEMMFEVAGVPMVENCIRGYNSCMLAYGPTGSGKTHTMLGDIEGGTRRDSVNSGMTPRVFEYLFSRIQKEREARREEKIIYLCKCSFLEIYNDQIFDLLCPSSINLKIREHTKKGVYVKNLTEVQVSSSQDVLQQLHKGSSNRKVAATKINRASSRSHSVFTCIIESKWESQGVTQHRFTKLNLVDLAGSESQKSSGATGVQLKEAISINKSLSTLGLVIKNLVGISNGKSLHVPYRDSKLTILLQDSLGGNSKTTIIANMSPSSCCSSETLSTLKFAQRAKFIKNPVIVNENASGDVFAMRMQIQQLKGVNEENELLRMKAIQNQSEMDALRKKLDSCIRESDKVERRLNNLVKVGEKRSLEVASQLELRPKKSDELATVASNDQTERKTMVDASASASQREAKAQEIATALSKENDELRRELKILTEENNKLIEVCEHAVSENKNKANPGAPDECCRCSRKSTCHTSRCKCQQSGFICDASCWCRSDMCINRVDSRQKIPPPSPTLFRRYFKLRRIR